MLNLERINRMDVVGAVTLAAALVLLSGCDTNVTPTATNTRSSAENPSAPAAVESSAAAPATETPASTIPTRLAQDDPSSEVDVAARRDAARNARAAQPEQPAAPDMDPPPITFEPAVLDFGVMVPGEEKFGEMTIRNMSDETLRIVASATSCKCTAIDLNNEEIGPHGTYSFAINMTPDDATGPKKAQVKIGFAGYGQVAVVDVVGEVSLPVNASPAYLIATADPVTGAIPLTGEVVVKSLDEKPFSILSADRQPPDFVDFDPASDSPRSHYTIRYDLTGYDPNNCSEWPGWFVIETDHPQAPIVDLRIRHMCTIPAKPGRRRWLVQGQRNILGNIAPGEPVEIKIPVFWIAGSSGDLVNAVVTSSQEFTVDLLATDYTLEEPEVTVRITPSEDVRGVLYGVIELYSAQANSAPFVIIGRVVEDEASAQ